MILIYDSPAVMAVHVAFRPEDSACSSGRSEKSPLSRSASNLHGAAEQASTSMKQR